MTSSPSPEKSLLKSLPKGLLSSPATITEALKQIDAEIEARAEARKLEVTRQNVEVIRARCRESFATFFREAWEVIEPATKLKWNWHLQAMCDTMQAAYERKINPHIIINVPPGSSKSTIVSVMFQAWVWGPRGDTGKRFVSSSFEMGNVTRDTRKCRDLILSEWFQTLWPILLKRAGESSFENFDFGFREGVPFKSLTGKRGDVLTIDDPHSLDQSESETERDKAVRLYIEGGQNRINDWENSLIIIVMQRLHEADLTGAILARDMGYVHLMLPMEFEVDRRCVIYDKQGEVFFEDPRTVEGELLAPLQFPRTQVDAYKRDNDYAHASQNQQRPVPREGGMFKVDRIQKVRSIPGNLYHCRGWDIAGSTRKKSPFTAGAHLAFGDGVLYIVHMERARKEIDEAERLIIDTAKNDYKRYGNVMLQSLPQDPGQSGKSQKRHLSNRLAGTNFHFSPESGTKEDRAIPLASYINSGNCKMLVADWNGPLENEMRNFPSSTYKDQVDALSRAFMELLPYMNEEEGDVIGAPIYVQS